MLPAHRAWTLMALVVAGCGSPRPSGPPVARDGVIDLSAWDFERQGAVPLRGEWMFRYGELQGPDALGADDLPTPPMIPVPDAWNGRLVAGSRLSGIGSATQALRLLLPPQTHDLALSFGEAHSADRLWLDGRLLMERGTVSARPEGEVPGVPGRIVAIGDPGGAVTLVLEISNHFHFEGGLLDPPRLGPRRELQADAEANARIDFFLIGCLVFIGLFYAALSMARPDPEIVLFSLLALLLALRTATIKWHLSALLPIGAEGQLRLDYITLIVLPPLFCALIQALFPLDTPRLLLRIAYLYGGVCLIGPLALGTTTFSAGRNFFMGTGLALAASALLSVARATGYRRKGASLILASGLAVLGIAVHDVASVLRLIPESRELLPLGNTILVFTHAVVLGRRLSDAQRESERLTASLRDANALLERRIAERTEELERMAMTDPLTGLLNRRPLLRLAEAERARALRSKQRIGVMMIDCDDFKLINDAHGHGAGDQVLRLLSARFLALVRSHDLLGRWGGEEFVMIFSTADTQGAQTAAERLRGHIAETPFEVSAALSLSLTVSVGVAILEGGAGESFEDLLRRADRALYAAKSEGKNRVVVAPQASSPKQA